MPRTVSRGVKFWLLYLLITSLLVVLVLEVAVRSLKLAPPMPVAFNFVADPVLPFKPQPFSKGISVTREFEYEYSHNSMGFRDVEHATVKQPGEFRILALGDSFTYGAGVSFNETYLSRLEQLLNSRKLHPKVEIIKAGVSRYYPEPERVLLEHYGLKYSPDLIIVGFVPNDVLDANQGLDSIKIGQSGYLVTREGQNKPRIFTLFYTYSHVFRILFNKYNAMTNKEPPIKWDEVYRPNGVFEKDWRSIEVEYEKMLQLAESAQARLIIVHIPQQGPWDDTKSYPATRLSEWSSAHGAQFIDTLPAMKLADPQKSLYYAQDGHCRAAGYEVIAETVYRELTTRGLVP